MVEEDEVSTYASWPVTSQLAFQAPVPCHVLVKSFTNNNQLTVILHLPIPSEGLAGQGY
jgi:hypothetical protein